MKHNLENFHYFSYLKLASRLFNVALSFFISLDLLGIGILNSMFLYKEYRRCPVKVYICLVMLFIHDNLMKYPSFFIIMYLSESYTSVI